MAEPTEQQLHDLERDVAAGLRVTQWGGIAALAISGLTLAAGACQTRLMQTQARAALWALAVLGKPAQELNC